MSFFTGDREKQLVKLLRSGDHAAMKEFYSLYGGFLTAVCNRYIANDEDMKDVMQDVMICIFTHIKDFEYRGKGSLKAWASRITANESLHFLRAQKKDRFTELSQDLPEEADDPPLDDVPPEVIQEFITELPPGYRTVFNLYVFQDYSHEEIAQKLGIKRDSSASQLHRAKNILAKKINEYRKNKIQSR